MVTGDTGSVWKDEKCWRCWWLYNQVSVPNATQLAVRMGNWKTERVFLRKGACDWDQRWTP